METKFFSHYENEQDLRIRAFKLKEILELDQPENSKLRSEVESEYQYLLNSFKKPDVSSEVKAKELTQEEIIEKISPLKLDVEICGSLIWIKGNTKPHRDFLKKLKMRFSPNKKCWYYRPDKFRSTSNQLLDMDEIRKMYGSEKVAMTG